MADSELDLPRLFEALDRHQVAYVLIGGLAAVYHGSPFPTEDADITPQAGRTNLARLAAALGELQARIRIESEPGRLAFACDADSLAAAQTWNLTTAAGDLDVAFEPDGTRGYADLRRDATPVRLYGATVHVATLADVIRSKQATNRPKDQRALPTLRKILAAGRGRAPGQPATATPSGETGYKGWGAACGSGARLSVAGRMSRPPTRVISNAVAWAFFFSPARVPGVGPTRRAPR